MNLESISAKVPRLHQGAKVGTLCLIEQRGDFWLCRCDCTKEVLRHKSNLRRNCTCSNGNACPIRREALVTHGLIHHQLYRVWASIIQRCYNPNDTASRYYRDRGIRVAAEWRNNFQKFYDDMSPGYVQGVSTIERIKNNGPYCKSNCRWATIPEQRRNTRQTRIVTTPKGDMCMEDAAGEYKLHPATLQYRINAHWHKDRLFLPPNASGRGPASIAASGNADECPPAASVETPAMQEASLGLGS
jgi:hypothetical protein